MYPGLVLWRQVNGAEFHLVKGDITHQEVDVIVNAANSQLSGGGGVDGAIHRAGGPTILAQCRQFGGCATGQAVVTGAGNLKAKHVIHTVGPIWSGKPEDAKLLRSAYRESLKKAIEVGARTVAFPSISTGSYAYPIHDAAPIAIQAVIDTLKATDSLEWVRFVLFSEIDAQAYETAARNVIDRPDFGCYWNFYQESDGAYLSLLNLNLNWEGDRMRTVVRKLRELAEHPDWHEDSLMLLAQRNWRQHLAPTVAMALTGKVTGPLLKAIWFAVARGSWVCPQLLCVLSQLDPDFSHRVNGFLGGDLATNSSGSSIVDHVELGPGNDDSRKGKVANALLGLAEAGVWKPSGKAREELERLAPHDFDRADGIATNWYNSLEELKARYAE